MTHGGRTTLTEHASGFPLPGTPPGRRLSRVEVAIDAFGQTSGDPSYSVDVFVDLQEAPDTEALGNSWSTHLQMRVKGARVSHGRFSYGTAGPCTPMTGFTARRIGR